MGAAASPVPAGPWTLRSQLQQIGFDTSQMADDQAAWSALAGRLAQWNQSQQQNAQLAQYGQFYLANKARFDALQQQGQGQGQPGVAQPGMQPGVGQPGVAQDKTKNLFGSPEFNPEWMKIVQFDPNTGKAVVPLGYDPSIGPKVDQYVAWRKDAFEKFLQDPISMLKDGLMPLIQQEAQKLAGQAVGGFSDQQFATQYVNSQPWMFQQDAQGNRVFDPVTGQPLLTPGGLRFRNYVEVATRQGIAGVREQAMWATAMVERDALIWQLQQAQAGQAQPGQAQPGQVQQGQAQPGTPGAVNAQQQAAALQMNGARRIAGSGANSTPQAPAAPAQPRRPLGRGALRSRLAGALQQAGIN